MSSKWISDPNVKGKITKLLKALEDYIGECHYYLRIGKDFLYTKKALKEKIDKLDYIKNVGLSKVAMKRMKK